MLLEIMMPKSQQKASQILMFFYLIFLCLSEFCWFVYLFNHLCICLFIHLFDWCSCRSHVFGCAGVMVTFPLETCVPPPQPLGAVSLPET